MRYNWRLFVRYSTTIGMAANVNVAVKLAMSSMLGMRMVVNVCVAAENVMNNINLNFMKVYLLVKVVAHIFQVADAKGVTKIYTYAMFAENGKRGIKID